MPNYGCERNSQIEMCYWRVAGTKIQIWEPLARVIIEAIVMDSITLKKYEASGQQFSTRSSFVPHIPGDATGIQWAEPRDVTKHSAMNKTVFQNVNRVEIENPILEKDQRVGSRRRLKKTLLKRGLGQMISAGRKSKNAF